MLTSVTETQDHMEKARKFVNEPDFAWRLSETTIFFQSSVTIKTSQTQQENGNPEELLKELVQSIVGHKSLKDVTVQIRLGSSKRALEPNTHLQVNQTWFLMLKTNLTLFNFSEPKNILFMAGKKYKERFADKMGISISREFEH